jgi:cellulose synthase/poly-beta-1,6-N-acetylglucosamine synthase-like glycosyltransferase
MKKVTILISLYKASEFLSAKLENLLKQTYFNKCCVVLLNCQNLENESLIYAEYTKKYKNIISKDYTKFIKLYSSWNDGIKMTKSKYIMNSNVDDMLHPDYVKTCCEYLDNNPETGCVTTQVATTYRSCQKYFGAVAPTTNKKSKFAALWDINSRLRIQYPKGTMGPCPMWRRSLHDKHGYFGDYLAIGDAVMWETWHNNNVKFGVINKNMVLYYNNRLSLERRFDKNKTPYIQLDLKSKEYKKHKKQIKSRMDMRNENGKCAK